MKLFKKIMSQLVLLGIIILIAVFGYIKSQIVETDTTVNISKTVIVDAGHGGLTNTID